MMIEVKNLNKVFKSYHALKDININVNKGEIYGFLGHNGAGKSTTINILTGLSKATSGKCIINGKELSEKTNPGDLNIGYLPEEPKFYPWMTAIEMLQYFGSDTKTGSSKERIDEILEWVGLTGSAKRKVGGYSRGMKQRLGIGAALINDPELLLLDEPASALDPEGRSDVIKLILDLKKRGKTVLFSTHILNDVERVCDRVSILSQGKVLFEKSLQDLLNENVLPVFDIKLKENGDASLERSIKQVSGVIKTEMLDDLLSVWVEDTESVSKELLFILSKSNNHVCSFTTRSKNLEDIFLEEVKRK